MAPRHPPRLVVRTLADAASERRRRYALIGGWVASLLVAGTGAWVLAGSGVAPVLAPDRGPLRAARTQNENLSQQVANLRRSAQVEDIAARELRRNLSDRDEEIAGLRADLAFYSRLVGGTGQRDGLKVQGARASAVPGARGAWNVVVTLTQNARRGSAVTGSLAMTVEGIQGNKVTSLQGAALGQSSTAGLPFSFRYFQQVQGSFTLPPGFRPARLRLTAAVAGDDPVSATIPWTDAIRNDEANDVQQSP